MIRRLPLFATSLLVCLLARGAFAQSADLSVTLSGPATVVANYDIATPAVTFSITNAGPATVQDLAIDFSSGLTVGLPEAFTCATVTDHVRCTTTSFPPTTVQGSASMQVHQPVDGTVVTLSATVSSATNTDPNAANNTSSVSETVTLKSFVGLGGIALSSPVPQGVKLDTGIYYENDGPSYATDVKITLSIPQHATFQSASPDSPFTCVTPAVGSPGDLVCTAKKLGATNDGFIQVDLNIDPTTPVGTTLTFVATMTCSDAAQAPQPMQTSVTVIAPADFTTSLASPASVEPGETFGNNLTVTNTGPGAAVNTQVTFTVSGGGSITSASGPAGWTCSVPTSSRATCSIASFAPGTATFSFPTSVASFIQPGKLTETVTARSASETTGLHDHATATTWVSLEKIPDFDLTIVAPPVVHPGGTITYTMTVANTTVNDAFPVLELTTSPLSGITWNCPDPVALGVCGLGLMAGGSSRTITASVPVVADSASKMTGIALIIGGPFLHNPRVTVTSTVEPTPPDLSVALTATPTTLTLGDTVTFTILVTNAGQVAAPNVTVHEPLPPSLTFVSATGHCTGDPDVQCSVGSLAPGAWATMTVTARAVESGTISVTATAMTDGSDPQASNNSATVPINVSAPSVRRRAARH